MKWNTRLIHVDMLIFSRNNEILSHSSLKEMFGYN
jgi:hypothetical protein